MAMTPTVGLALVGVALAGTPEAGLAGPPDRQAVRKVMNDKELLVRGWDQKAIETILRDFKKLYEEHPGSGFAVAIETRPDGAVRVTFPVDVAPDLFPFLVNYVQYPKGFDLRGRLLTVVGRTTLSRAFSLPDPALEGQKASIYVPADDREHDEVYVRTDAGQTFVNSFAASRWKPVRDARLPDGFERLR